MFMYMHRLKIDARFLNIEREGVIGRVWLCLCVYLYLLPGVKRLDCKSEACLYEPPPPPRPPPCLYEPPQLSTTTFNTTTTTGSWGTGREAVIQG